MALTKVTGNQVRTTSTGDVAATDGQAAIAELASEKVPLNGTGATGTWGISISGSAAQLGGVASTNYARKDSAGTFSANQTPNYSTGTITSTTTYSYDGSTTPQVYLITLTNAITVTFGAPSNISPGTMYKFILKAGDTNSRTFAWNTAFKFPSGVAPLTSGSVTNGAHDVITFIGGASNTLIYDGHCVDIR